MTVGIQKAWSLTASDNGSADDNINFAEQQSPASLNNSARALMATVKGWANQISAAKTTGGSSNAYTFTSDSVAAIATSYAAGMAFAFKANHTNTGAATLNVDGVGAKNIRKGGAQAALAANDIVSGGIYLVMYEASGDCFALLNPETGATAQDATLTALEALSWSSGSPLIQFTAADTVSLTLTPSVTSVGVAVGSAGSPALYCATDTNTGIHMAGSDVMDFSTGGTSRWRVNAAGTLLGVSGLPLFQAGSGAVGGPGISFQADPDCGFYVIGTNNIGFALNGTKYVDYATTRTQFITPVQAPLAVSSETAGTLTVASANKQVNASGGVTIDDGVFAADTWVFIENSSGSAITITQATGMTLRLHGTATTGSRTLAVYSGAAIRFKTNSDAIVYGDVT